MTTFQPGDIVDITIKGARIANCDSTNRIWFNLAITNRRGYVPILDEDDAATVTVERVAPAEWPPRPGDLWRDKHGELWFVYTNPGLVTFTDDGALHGRTTGGKRWTDDAARLIADNAPLTLVHREDPR